MSKRVRIATVITLFEGDYGLPSLLQGFSGDGLDSTPAEQLLAHASGYADRVARGGNAEWV